MWTLHTLQKLSFLPECNAEQSKLVKSIWEPDNKAAMDLMNQGSHACKTKHLRVMMIVAVAPLLLPHCLQKLHSKVSRWRHIVAVMRLFPSSSSSSSSFDALRAIIN